MLNMNASKRAFVFLCLAASLNLPVPLRAQTPEWIWHDNKGAAPADGEVRYFRKTFAIDGPVAKAVLSAAGFPDPNARPARHTLALGAESNALVTCDFVAVFG